MSFSLACRESGRSGLLGQMGGCSPHHGGCTSREVDILAPAGYCMLQGGTTIGSGTQA